MYVSEVRKGRVFGRVTATATAATTTTTTAATTTTTTITTAPTTASKESPREQTPAFHPPQLLLLLQIAIASAENASASLAIHSAPGRYSKTRKPTNRFRIFFFS